MPKIDENRNSSDAKFVWCHLQYIDKCVAIYLYLFEC